MSISYGTYFTSPLDIGALSEALERTSSRMRATA